MDEPRQGDPDIRLMLAARGDDLDAFGQLHDRYQPKIRRFFYGLTGAPQEASDLCQETFVRVWRIRKRYRATGSFQAYLFGVAKVVWMEHRRRVARLWQWEMPQSAAPPDAASTAPGPAEQALGGELREHIFAALNDLPEEQRLVFVMRTIDGLGLEDIARALDCPVNTVRSRKLLAVKRLRHRLRELYAEWTHARPEVEP
ncbi:MAG: sigma-70 family RNA polymerase sigma factor [Candidatus Hydrogenedens sp.]|nr:sigma-70 family RNA polymerase sigma factor [Candidatus Hydrogenedens sp.]